MLTNINKDGKKGGGCGAFGGDISPRNEENSCHTSSIDVPLENVIREDYVNHVPELPEEIWGIIFDSLEDSKSMQQMLRVFPSLGNTFKNKMRLWIFDQIFPCLFPHLSKEDILRCTHVCKTWRHIIFKFMEEHPSKRPYNEDQSNPVMADYSSGILVENFTVEFKTPKSIDRFLKINPQHMNPFIGRSVSLDFDREIYTKQELELLSINTNLLFQDYGKNIWYFRMANYFYDESLDAFYNRLVQILSLLPNLRSLHISGSYDTMQSYDMVPCCPFPPLPNLESLKLEVTHRTQYIVDSLIRAYTSERLKAFSLQSIRWFNYLMPPLLTLPENATFKSLTQVTLFYEMCDMRHFIPKLSMHNLQKMEVDGKVQKNNPRLYFYNLDGFQIRVLHMKDSPMPIEGVCNSKCRAALKCTTWGKVIINLPKLHTVRVRHKPEHSYKFLERIPLLQHLEIWTEAAEYLVRSEWWKHKYRAKHIVFLPEKRFHCNYDEITIELCKWLFKEPKLDKSYIWNLLPKLKTLTISHGTVRTYQRIECML